MIDGYQIYDKLDIASNQDIRNGINWFISRMLKINGRDEFMTLNIYIADMSNALLDRLEKSGEYKPFTSRFSVDVVSVEV